MQLNPCKYCGATPLITDYKGIGRIYCPTETCQNHAVYDSHSYKLQGKTYYYKLYRYQYSGKMAVSKKDVIRLWNVDNPIE